MRSKGSMSNRPPMFPLMPFVPMGLLFTAAVGTVAVWRRLGRIEARLDAMDGAASHRRAAGEPSHSGGSRLPLDRGDNGILGS